MNSYLKYVEKTNETEIFSIKKNSIKNLKGFAVFDYNFSGREFGIIDKDISNKIYNQINQDTSANLIPIKTIGDGNCLCSAVLQFLTGNQDKNKELRNHLKKFMKNHEEKLFKLWQHENLVPYEDSMIDEWNGTVNFTDNQYLEKIHVFALANILKRMIIVHSDVYVKDIQKCDINGFYLPFLINIEDVIDQPITIGFSDFHFVSLIPEINNPETSPNHEILTPLYSIKPNGSTIAMKCAYAEAYAEDDFIVDYWSAYNFKEINGKTFCVVKQNGRI